MILNKIEIVGAYPTTYPSQSRFGDNLKSHWSPYLPSDEDRGSRGDRCRSLHFEFSKISYTQPLKEITRSRGKIFARDDDVSIAKSELLNPRARINDNRRPRVVVVWPGRPTTPMYILLFDATCWSSERERERGNGSERPRRRVATRPSTRAIGASGMPSKNRGRSRIAGSSVATLPKWQQLMSQSVNLNLEK